MVPVLGLVLVLAGCQSGKGGTAQDSPKPDKGGDSTPAAERHDVPAVATLPLATDMPAPLKLARDANHYGEVQGVKGTMKCPKSEKRCADVLSGATTVYGSDPVAKDADWAKFSVWEYPSPVSSQVAFDDWKTFVRSLATGYLPVADGRFGEQVSAVSAAPAKQQGDRAMVLRQGKYVGVVVTNTKADIVGNEPTALYELTKMLAERLRQADQNQAPAASAAHVKLPG
ncbi:hypothetical protein [Streptomyces sp. Da 82-17]|uniref:hypothetical protein n=1 Tax=Streptomyces sp. Da 82-17 TaxID=3377116 RepID=UPI0038D4B336